MHEDFQKWKKMQFSENAFYLKCMQIHCLSTYVSLHIFFYSIYFRKSIFQVNNLKFRCNKEINWVGTVNDVMNTYIIHDCEY